MTKFATQAQIQGDWMNLFRTNSLTKAKEEAVRLQNNAVPCRVVELIEPKVIEEYFVQ